MRKKNKKVLNNGFQMNIIIRLVYNHSIINYQILKIF